MKHPEKRRFIKVISTHEDVLGKLDPELVPTNQLDALNTALRAAPIWTQVTSYASNANPAHLANANNQLSTQLTSLSLLLAIAKRTVREIPLRGLEKSVDEMSEALIAKKQEIVSKYETLSGTLDDLQEDVTKLGTLVETRRTETDAQLSQWQKQFSESQERRSTDYTAWREENDKQAKSLLALIDKDTREAAEVIEENFATEADKIIVDAKEKHKAILELYELTAGDSVGAGYLQNADVEKGQANLWRWISVAFILATAIWLGFTYYQTIYREPEVVVSTAQEKTTAIQADKESLPAIVSAQASSKGSDINWLRLIATLSLTGVFLFGAAYSSQQSNRHRTNERKARRFALEMKAFDPFINSLSTEVQNDLKQKLSEKLFGNHDEKGEHEAKVIDEHAATN